MSSVRCPKCNGSGLFRNLGKCFTCLGSGVMNQADLKRCQAYQQRYAAQSKQRPLV